MGKPLFDPTIRQFFRDFTNSVTDFATTVGVKAAHRDNAGNVIRDRNGVIVYDGPTTYNALVVYEQKIVATPKGEQKVARGEVTFSFPPPLITTDDRLVIDGIEVAIIGVSRDDSTDPMAPTRCFV